jgi:ubiquitin carboxyl-terminal hydrolase 4/11/15
MIFVQNSNAYLLFYKRRSNAPLGGKSHEKIEETLRKTVGEVEVESIVEQEAQLPTPPSESAAPVPFPLTQQPSSVGYLTPRSNTRSTPTSSPPPLDDCDPPTFEDSQNDELLMHGDDLDPLEIASQKFDFPDPSARASPTSSIEAEPDYDDPPRSTLFRSHADINCWVASNNGLPSPDSDIDPFSNAANLQKTSDDNDSMMDTEEEIPRQ